MSTRDVNLKSYLPTFLEEFAEYEATLDAEDPEFALMWEAANQVLDNAFIATADEYGISRYESLLGLTYSSSDTLESRRNKVLARWFFSLPYTTQMLLSQLIIICGEDNVALSVDPDTYTVYVVTDLETYGLVDEVDALLQEMIPANMVINSQNVIPCEPDGAAYFAGGVCSTETFQVSNDYEETCGISASALQAGGAVETEWFQISNDAEETYTVSGDAFQAGGIVDTTTVVLVSEE